MKKYLKYFVFLIFISHLYGQDLSNYVDTRIGSRDNGLESGYTFIGATYPFGMIQFTPSFFSPDRGFVVTQLSGAGCSNMGNFPVVPISGEVKTSPNRMNNFNNIQSVDAHEAGLLSATVNNDVSLSLTASKRAGFAKFIFNNTDKGTIAIGSGINSTEVSDAHVKVTSDTSCEGFARGGDFCGAKTDYTVFFAVEFDKPSIGHKVWRDANLIDSGEVKGPNSGVLFEFDTTIDKTVNYRIAISFVSIENAKDNLKSENLNFSFDSYREKNKAEWNKFLNKIKVTSDNQDRLIQFYTSFYRSLIHPNIISDANGEYMGADFKVHKTLPGREQYSSFSAWDTYRTQAQLLAWLFPKKSSDMMQSLVDFADQAGGYGRWILANVETGIMQGDPTSLIIANSYAFGATDFDTKNAYFHMLRGATVPKLKSQEHEIRPFLSQYIKNGYMNASMLLEYTSADFAIGQFAESALQLHQDSNYFLNRSNHWKNIYNPETKWLNSKFENGKWKPQTDDWREGTYKNYFWMIPYDLDDLIDTIGGSKFAEDRLDILFERLDAKYDDDWFASGNEPDFHVPWVYNWTESPEKTSITIQRILDEMYDSSDSGLPGNDDLGTMGAWYVFSSIGLYPIIPGVPGFSLNLPQFDHITIDLPNNELVIKKGNSDVHVIKSLSVNGEEHNSTWLDFEKIENGGVIHHNKTKPLNKWKIINQPPKF